MVSSIKTAAHIIGKHCGATSCQVYERQRELVRAKLLPGPTGRGPGSGTPASVENVAVVVLSFLATDNLSDVASATVLAESDRPGLRADIEAMLRSTSGADGITYSRRSASASLEISARISAVALASLGREVCDL